MCWHELIPSPTRVLSLIPMNSAIQHETPSVTANTLFGFIRSESPQNDKIKWWSGSTFSNQHNDELCVSASCREEKCYDFFSSKSEYCRFGSEGEEIQPISSIQFVNNVFWTSNIYQVSKFVTLNIHGSHIIYNIYHYHTNIEVSSARRSTPFSIHPTADNKCCKYTLSHKKNCQTSQPEQYH